MIERKIDQKQIIDLIEQFPVTAILGARQTGKTTIARQLKAKHYFDLENPQDLAQLDNPQITLENLTGLIVIDEIQRRPEIFPLLRYLVDTNPAQKYIILGSASRDLIMQSSETLAGRIVYYKLSGFRLEDIGLEHWQKLWLRGNLPLSYMAKNDAKSHLWRQQYITTFLERDIPQLGIRIPSQTLRRFWTMLSHYHGQLINYSELGKSFGISDMTIRKYIEILEGTFMLRTLWPWHSNTKKRLVKRPKIYFQDSGLYHSLASIKNMEQLKMHPKLGASWEGFALINFCRIVGKEEESFYFWATHNGAELDLFWQENGKNFGAEFKYMDAPKLSKSMKIAMQDLDLDFLWVIYPGNKSYKLAENISVVSLSELIQTGLN